MKDVKMMHGDVSFILVDSIPTEAKRVKVNEGFVVEKGEGIHTHILRRKSPCAKRQVMVKELDDEVEIYQISDTMFIKVKKETIIDHEEHGKQVLTPGIYRKQIEREYDANSDAERKVRD